MREPLLLYLSVLGGGGRGFLLIWLCFVAAMKGKEVRGPLFIPLLQELQEVNGLCVWP